METKLPTAILLTVLLISGICVGTTKGLPKKAQAMFVRDEFAFQASAPDSPRFNLDIVLHGEGKASGRVKFRQNNDSARIVTLGVSVEGLQANHQYLLQRAVDADVDGNCTSVEWLTLGKGLQVQSITTDARGKGGEELWRDLSMIPRGKAFDIHFRIIDAKTNAIVLTSVCYQYAVR